MNITKILLGTAFSLATTFNVSHANDNSWFVRANVGTSSVSDQNASANDFAVGINSLDASLDSGFAAGLGLGYQYTPSVGVELGWEYRSNDSAVTLNDGQVFPEGNYASNVFYLNGIYTFQTQSNWQPYAGVGVTWVQEIDIDIEKDGVERSFSNGGDTGVQAFVGVNRKLSPQLSLQGELRYGSISNIDLDEEDGNGTLADLDYDPFTLQVGLQYRF